ncbi:hypothetical protein [Nostoc sp. PCC 7107]|uniref:hypothetical protein n=1 Tax=Nostoc sp. PCC 7107 TaxID=317936 RepID=UPI00029F084F|nr:hypothetical protein [Nostoc sp. PCC 7107]AFY44742.1 hypothetical protein Nos7107_4191 [Nostoc sp. PCC 7107]
MENLEPINDSSGVEAENYPTSPQIFSQNSHTNQRQLLIYVIPVLGVLPSLWTLYRRQGSREQLRVSRQSITMTFTWLLAYLLLATGAASSEFLALRLLILNSLITSGYFLVSIWLISRIIRGQSSRLPGLSNLAERVLGKHLS